MLSEWHQRGYIWQILLKWTQVSDRLCFPLMNAVTTLTVWKIRLKGHNGKHEGKELQSAHRGPGRGGGGPLFPLWAHNASKKRTQRGRHSLLWTRVFGFTFGNHKTAHPGKDRKRKLPTHSLTFLWGTRACVVQGEDPWGPLPLGCVLCRWGCPLPWGLLKALDWLPSILWTRTKRPPEKSRPGASFALLKSEVSFVVWIQPGEAHPNVDSNCCESPQATDQLRTLSSLFCPVWLLLQLHWEGVSGELTWARYCLGIVQWWIPSPCSVPPSCPKWRENHSRTNRLKMRLAMHGVCSPPWKGTNFSHSFGQTHFS